MLGPEAVAQTGSGMLIGEDLGIKIGDMVLQMLGRAKRVRTGVENTTFVDGAGKTRDIDDKRAFWAGR